MPALTFTDRLFATAIRLRLGLNIPAVAVASKCPCGGAIDSYGNHLLSCRSGNERNRRHAAGVRAWKSIFSQARCTVLVEQLLRKFGIHLPGKDPDRRSMDLLAFLNWDVPGFSGIDALFCDYTVVFPCAASFLSIAAASDGAAVSKAESKKDTKYKASIESDDFGRRFVPLACEVLGRLGPAFLALLRALAHVVPADRDPDEAIVHSRLVERWMRIHAVALQRANARLLLSRALHASVTGMGSCFVSINDLLHDAALDCDRGS